MLCQRHRGDVGGAARLRLAATVKPHAERSVRLAGVDDTKAERRLMARYAYREAWARSIRESHAPGEALDAALIAHASDTLKIAEALKARGVDLAELDAMIK